jgi:hypothetical protein
MDKKDTRGEVPIGRYSLQHLLDPKGILNPGKKPFLDVAVAMRLDT